MQSYPIKEIIIYDDASTDASREILEELEKTYTIIKVIYADSNRGVSVARDTAIRAASSEFVTMIDADDFYWDNNKLEKEMLLINESTEQICAFSQTVKVDESGEALGEVRTKRLNKHIRWKTVTRLFGIYAPRDYCFPRQVYIELGGYLLDMNLYEDWELNLRLMSKCKFVYSGSYGTAYRQKKGGLSSADAKRHLEAKKRAFLNNSEKLRYTILEKLMFYILLYFNYARKLIKVKLQGAKGQ